MPPTPATPCAETVVSRPVRRHVLALLPTALVALVLAVIASLSAPTGPGLADPSLVSYRWTMNIADSFHRHVRGSFGHARIGGRYVRTGHSWVAVARRHGQIGPVAPGGSVALTLNRVHSADEIARLRFSLPRLSTRGNGTFVMVMLRRLADGSSYLARLRVGAYGELRVSIAKTVNGHDTYLTGESPVPGHLRPGQSVIVEGYVAGGVPAEGTGSQSPRIGVRGWIAGHREPGWQYMVTDGDAGRLAAGTGIGVRVYQSAASSAGTVMVHRFLGWHGHPIIPVGSPSSSSSAPSSAAPSTSSSSSPSSDPASSSASSSASSDPTSVAPSSSAPSSSAPTSADPSSSATTSDPAPSSTSASPSPSSSSSTSPAPAGQPAGAAPLGSAQYAVPANAVYVAPNGSDGSGTGSISAPFATLSRAISAAPTGGTVVLRGGQYNQSVFVGKAVTIEGYPGEAAWLDGSIPVNGWTQSGSTWVHSGWTYQFDHSSSFSTGYNDSSCINPNYPMAAWPDQVFADGAQLQQVSGTPGPGQFSVNYANSTITVGSDPSGVAMRASNLQTAMTVGAGNVTLRGFGVRNYATSMPQMGTVFFGGSVGHDLVQNMIFTQNATQGLSVDTSNVTVDHVTSSNNGMTGIHASIAPNAVIENSLLTGNNTQHFNPEPSAAAIKVGRLDGVTISNNVITGNLGVNGIWTDENVTHFVITGNTVSNNNAQYGIITELSDTGIVAGNTISGTRYGYTAFDTGDVQVFNNTFSGNSVWDIGLSQDNRYQPGMSTAGVNPTAADPWIVRNIVAANNDVTHSSAIYEFYALDKQTNRSADSMNITLHGNLFRTRSTSGPWPIGWGGSDNTTVTNYAGPRPWEIAHSLPVMNESVATASDPAPSDMSGLLVPLPSSVAAPLGVPAGTVHLGAF